MNKKLQLIILVFTLSLTATAQPRVFNNSNIEIPFSKILEVLTEELGLDTVTMNIYISSGNLNFNLDGKITTLSIDSYSINIQAELFKAEQIKVFIHECIHLSQIAHGHLVIRSSFVWFDGKIISPNSTYEERPYEVEAIERTEALFNKYNKSLR